jgi:hypothetical protein
MIVANITNWEKTQQWNISGIFQFTPTHIILILGNSKTKGNEQKCCWQTQGIKNEKKREKR